MKKLVGIFVLGACLLSCAAPKAEEKEVINLIFETDMGNDVDDVLALDVLFKCMDAGTVNLLGIGINKVGEDGRQWPAEFVDIMRTWYGHENVPIGILKEGGADCSDEVNYARAVCRMENEAGEPLFARSIDIYEELPDVPTLYRTILSSQPDNSVTMVSVGFSTNLAALLDTPADEVSPLTGAELVAAKVRELSVMAGKIDDSGYHEYNVVKDVKAAQKVFAEWPTLMVVSPFELGKAVMFPGNAIWTGFDWLGGARHPAVEAYRSYKTAPYDRPSWDVTSVLYAVEGAEPYFTVSPLGNIVVDDEGGTVFTEDPQGKRQYLSVSGDQPQLIIDRMVEIISAKPASYKY